MSERILKLNKLSIGYNGVSLADDINAAVERGKITALIGPNGGGKSTLLKTIIGELAPIAGNVEIGGRNLQQIRPSERAKMIAIVMTARPRTELMNVRDIVESGRYPYTNHFGHLGEKDLEVVSQAMELMNAAELSEQLFERLSDGQKTRVMLARALAQEPDILVLDEPTGFLDINYKLELISLLKKVAKERNIAVIMSIHELELVQSAADRIICIKKGGTVREGSYEEIFTEAYLRTLFDIQSSTFSDYFRKMLM